MEYCAGIVAFRYNEGTPEVLLCHPGGPYFKNLDYWGIPKGHIEPGEDPKKAAAREFTEETGCELTEEDISSMFMLGTFQQNLTKKVTVYAISKDYDLANFTCNEATIEFPKGSGKTITFKENDKADWFDIETAQTKVFKGQTHMILSLKTHLEASKT